MKGLLEVSVMRPSILSAIQGFGPFSASGRCKRCLRRLRSGSRLMSRAAGPKKASYCSIDGSCAVEVYVPPPDIPGSAPIMLEGPGMVARAPDKPSIFL